MLCTDVVYHCWIFLFDIFPTLFYFLYITICLNKGYTSQEFIIVGFELFMDGTYDRTIF